jgi:hypothetical protein
MDWIHHFELSVFPRLLGWLFLGLVLVELLLRWGLGLGRRLLYIPDPNIGYLLAPDQAFQRLGRRFVINQYSMRNQAIAVHRTPNTLRILLLGDSIANGGWWTDQQETISALIENALQIPQFKTVEVLNASANSWGPRNQQAYLERFGTFESQWLVLLLNSDDLFAIAPTSLGVGLDPHYPVSQPSSALGDLIQTLWPQRLRKPLEIPGLAQVLAEKGDRVGYNLTAIEQIQKQCQQSQCQFLLALTPLKRQVDNSRFPDYEKTARERLEHFTQTNKIIWIDFLPLFQQTKQSGFLYRDTIHLSPKGNQWVSNVISQTITQKYQNHY